MRPLLTGLLFLAVAGSALAQVQVDSGTGDVPEPPAAENRIEDYLGSPDAAIAPSQDELMLLDEAGQAALREALTAYYRYRTTGFEHRRRVFDWQHRSSQIIFGIVILLVGIGIYFSWLQFMAAARPPPASAPLDARTPETTAPGSDPPARLLTSIEASLQGIKVSSPVLGVVILVISLAFFYLYLVHVYPINEVF